MQIQKQELEPILEYLNKKFASPHGDNYMVKQIKNILNKSSDNFVNLESLSYLYGREMLQNTLVQNELIALGEKNGSSYPEFIEKELLKNSWGGEKIVFYTKLIKDKIYYPKDDSVILDVVTKNSYENNRIFKTLLNLSSLIKDDSKSCDAFAATMNKRSKYNPLATLELEKIERLFQKRFKKSDKESLPSESLKTMNEIFSKIEEKASSDFMKEEEGQYFKVMLDADAISQKQKLTVGKVSDGIRKLLNTFKYFTESESDIVKQMTISKFSYDFSNLNNLQITLQYNNPEVKETLIPIFKELLVDGLVKGNDKDLKCVDIINSYDDTDEYYEKYFHKAILEKELGSKANAAKKMKI